MNFRNLQKPNSFEINFMAYSAIAYTTGGRLDFQPLYEKRNREPPSSFLGEERRSHSRKRRRSGLWELLMNTWSCVCWPGQWHTQLLQSFQQMCEQQQKHSRCSLNKAQPASEKYQVQTSTANSKRDTGLLTDLLKRGLGGGGEAEVYSSCSPSPTQSSLPLCIGVQFSHLEKRGL